MARNFLKLNGVYCKGVMVPEELFLFATEIDVGTEIHIKGTENVVIVKETLIDIFNQLLMFDTGKEYINVSAAPSKLPVPDLRETPSSGRSD